MQPHICMYLKWNKRHFWERNHNVGTVHIYFNYIYNEKYWYIIYVQCTYNITFFLNEVFFK